jgi:sec-independent protein translocase protein TatA
MGTSLFSPVHLIILLLVLLLLFGAKRLPEIGRSLGTGMREFKDSVTTSDHVEAHSELPPPAPVAPVVPPAVDTNVPAAPAAEPEREAPVS